MAGLCGKRKGGSGSDAWGKLTNQEQSELCERRGESPKRKKYAGRGDQIEWGGKW